MRPGSGFLCRVNDPETAYYFPESAQTPWSFVYACFAGPSAVSMVNELVDRFGPVYQLAQSHDSIRMLLGWHGYADAQPTLSPARGARIVLDLLADLAAAKENPRTSSPANELTRRAQQLIERNLQANWNASQLAQSLDVSREHLTRVFKEQTGQTPYRYMLRRRMLLACHLLKETDLTNKQIAARLGCPAAQFSRSFRSVMHLSPSRFREVGITPVS
jgi:AraC-like DNA-binding protein